MSTDDPVADHLARAAAGSDPVLSLFDRLLYAGRFRGFLANNRHDRTRGKGIRHTFRCANGLIAATHAAIEWRWGDKLDARHIADVAAHWDEFWSPFRDAVVRAVESPDEDAPCGDRRCKASSYGSKQRAPKDATSQNEKYICAGERCEAHCGGGECDHCRGLCGHCGPRSDR